MMLNQRFHALLEEGWKGVFRQARSHHRAIEHALAWPSMLGRRNIARTICVLGRSNQDWSADYKIYSRSPWTADRLFDPVIKAYLERYRRGPIPVAVDDTKLPKTGKKIPHASWHRDPLSPPFHVNLLYGLRFVQASLLFPHYREGNFSARALPVRFQEAAPVKKPGRRASPAEQEQYRLAKRQTNLSTQSLQVVKDLRLRLDEKGGAQRRLLAVLDGSFCNRTFFKADLDRVDLLARCRKDARLCFPAPEGSRRKYALEIFTPEQVRQDTSQPWNKARIYFGGKRRSVKYKVIEGVLWKRGAGRRRLRLLVIAPTPYKLSIHGRTNYREPAYLLCTDLTSAPKFLLQSYVDRWEIEVNHRDEKDLMGVGQAQVHALRSMPRHPAFAVACYSLLLLAALLEFGPARTEAYLPLPKWRKQAKRASLVDMLALLRKEINETSVSSFLNQHFAKNMTLYAHT